MSPYPHRLTPERPWAPLSDAEWQALLPFVLARAPQGRQVADLRARMDAIFELTCRAHDTPWREVRPEHGKPDTISRFFRRLTHRGLWQRLLQELALLPPDHALRRIEWFICKATRRAARIGGLRLLFLIRRLGLEKALNAPPWLLPDLRLSDHVRTLPMDPPGLVWGRRGFRGHYRGWLRMLKNLHRMAGGRTRIHRSVRLSW